MSPACYRYLRLGDTRPRRGVVVDDITTQARRMFDTIISVLIFQTSARRFAIADTAWQV